VPGKQVSTTGSRTNYNLITVYDHITLNTNPGLISKYIQEDSHNPIAC